MDNDLPPIWALDEATRRSTRFKSWEEFTRGTTFSTHTCQAVIAHARTIAKHETAPVDPDEAKLCRVMNAWHDAPLNVDYWRSMPAAFTRALAALKVGPDA